MRFDAFLTSPSKRLAAILGGFCFGVLIGPLFLWASFEWLVGVLMIGFIVLLLFGSPRLQPGSDVGVADVLRLKPGAPIVLAVLLSILFGIFRYIQSDFPSYLTTLTDKTGVSVRVEGLVASEVERRINGQQVVLRDVRVADESVAGKLLVRMSLYPQVQYRDHVQLSCRLEHPEPFNGFAYDRLLRSKGILATCSFPQFVDTQHDTTFSVVGSLLALKQSLIDHLKRILPEPHASFLSGLLFGGGSALSKDLKDDFSETGTSHILAASGFNVSLFSVAFLGWILSTRLGRKRSLYVTAVILVAYVILAGATPAVVRAAVMAGLILVQHVVRREPYRLNMLLLAASMLLIANPRILLDDPGFQLSFAATTGILYLSSRWTDHFDFLPERFGIRESFVASLVASLCTLPILLWHFGSISILAPLVNLLVLPLVPYAMALTLVAVLASYFWIPLAQLVVLPAWGFSVVILAIIRLFGSL